MLADFILVSVAGEQTLAMEGGRVRARSSSAPAGTGRGQAWAGPGPGLDRASTRAGKPGPGRAQKSKPVQFFSSPNELCLDFLLALLVVVHPVISLVRFETKG